MITVTISINDRTIYTRTAVNMGLAVDKDAVLANPGELCLYKLDTGKEILHSRSDGAVALVHEMLDTIHEV